MARALTPAGRRSRVTPLDAAHRPAHELRSRDCLAIDVSDEGAVVAPNRVELGLSFER
ncbi:MAG: hypothetical protein KDA24_26760 [Deltaproteobacteria bacterium]|nr:hypothetical protein [Deltaproteobacteria bacterium]